MSNPPADGGYQHHEPGNNAQQRGAGTRGPPGRGANPKRLRAGNEPER